MPAIEAWSPDWSVAIQSTSTTRTYGAACHTPARQEAVREALLEAVRSGRIPESRIDTSVRRILECKEKFALEERRARIRGRARLGHGSAGCATEAKKMEALEAVGFTVTATENPSFRLRITTR